MKVAAAGAAAAAGIPCGTNADAARIAATSRHHRDLGMVVPPLRTGFSRTLRARGGAHIFPTARGEFVRDEKPLIGANFACPGK
ncbi:hypothetical protein GCM10009765_35750 [Fodinicola feengrottensis]|uniref:Secreted protein n=1 Tax=Fodinicola feengrottensis TaxID=435914 RepID=A0ABN2H8I3_9ACTN